MITQNTFTLSLIFEADHVLIGSLSKNISLASHILHTQCVSKMLFNMIQVGKTTLSTDVRLTGSPLDGSTWL